ncbi:hypothetical protein MMC15_006091 [Xylographa vitiligo]|nr:hypothetical protein [Xylographa vitiligo]
MADPAASLSPVLVTGGCGFIGFHIVSKLLEADPTCQIHVLDIDTSRNRLPTVVYHTCDITSFPTVSEIVHAARPKTVFHVACPDSMVIRPALFERVNVGGTAHLLQAALATGSVHAFVNTSTSSVIHDNLTDLVDADETLPVLQPPLQKRAYTLTKAAAEAAVLAANRLAGDASMLTVSLRPATAFGERDTICMGKIVANARAGKARFQMGPGGNLYDFIYAGNLADAHLLAAQALVRAYGHSPPADPRLRVDGETFNVTNDERILFWEFSRRIAAAVGHPVRDEEVVVIPVWVGLLIGLVSEWVVWAASWGNRQSNVTWEGMRLSTITRTLNGEKAKRVLGFRAKVGVVEGIERGARWFVEEAERGRGLGVKKVM